MPLQLLPGIFLRNHSRPFFRTALDFQPFFNKQAARGMKAFIQFIGQNSPEGPPSLLVHYDSQRYLINCREGTQRLCVQDKVRFGKLNKVFLTRINWECVGGLPGMLLTLTDTGIGNIDLYGGKTLSHFIAATRQFVYRTNANVNVHEFDENAAPYTDKTVTVTPVIVLPDSARKRKYDEFKKDDSNTNDMDVTSSGSSSESDTERRGHPVFNLKGKEADDYRLSVISQMFTNKASTNQKAPGHTIEADCTPRATAPTNKPKRQQPAYLVNPLPKTSSNPAAISYIWKGPTVPRKFNKDAAIKLGLKPGPNYGKLQKGISVTTDDGRVITQDMVCEPEKPGHVFIIVDCPNTTYIDSLVYNAKFDPYKKNGNTKVHTIIHNIGKNVLRDPRYLNWLQSFDTDTDHIFGSTDICAQTVQFRSHALGQVKLSMLNKDIFPIPHYNNTPKVPLREFEGLPERSYALESMATYILEPKPRLQPPDIPLFDHTDTNAPEIQELNQLTEYHEAVKLAKEEAGKVHIDEAFPGSDVEVITLGTGSSIPAKYRNVSATLIKVPGYGSIMLDAGEGTYGQMMRRFGIEQLAEEINSLRCIFVSHLHADHHLGVIQLINKWNRMHWKDDATLTIVAPFIYRNWLTEYNRVEYIWKRNKHNFIRCESILANETPAGAELKNLERLKNTLGLSTIEPVDVIHCQYAYGLSLAHKSGWKLVYSGDTRPCNKLVDRGKDATLLIHEATLEDAEQEKAIAKRHTTLSEAIDVGERMNAKFTLLNHFSQRYPKLPVISKDSNVCFSFDLMSLPIKHMPLLPKYTDAMLLAFKDDDEDSSSDKKALLYKDRRHFSHLAFYMHLLCISMCNKVWRPQGNVPSPSVVLSFSPLLFLPVLTDLVTFDMAEPFNTTAAKQQMVPAPFPTATAPPAAVDGPSNMDESINRGLAPNTPPPSVRTFNKPAITNPAGVSFEQDPSGYLRAKMQSLVLWENRRNSALVLVGTLSFLILTQYYSLLQIAAGLFCLVTGLNWTFVIIHKQGQKYIYGKASKDLTNPHSERLRYNGSYIPRERIVHLAQLSVDVFEVLAQQITKLVLIENSCRSAVALGISFVVWTLAKYVSTKYLFGLFVLYAFTLPRFYSQHQAVIDAHLQKSVQQARALSEKYGGLAYNKAREMSQQATGFIKQKTAKMSAATTSKSTSNAAAAAAAAADVTPTSAEPVEKKDD